MKALVLEEPGDPPRLEVLELPMPTPGPDEVLIQVTACGLCYHDLLVIRGVLRRGVKSPLVLGHEVAGEVVQTGPEVTGLVPGDLVASTLTDACGTCDRCQVGLEHRCRHGHGIGHSIDGGLAQYIKLRHHSLVKLPPGTDPMAACLLGCPMGIAYRAVVKIGEVKAGETVLVTGASGGLGSHAIQIAKARGATVLAVTSSEGKEEALASLGADQVICSQDLDFSEVALALTEDRGVDVVVDTVGSPTFAKSLRSLAQYGRLVLLGEVGRGAASVPLAEVIFRDARILGSSGTSRQDLMDASEMVEQGTLKGVVQAVYPLDDWPEALEAVASPGKLGRIVVTP